MRSVVTRISVLGLVAFAACEADEGRPVYPKYEKSVAQLAKDEGLTTFLDLAALAGLDAPLGSTRTTYTVLAPNDAAWTAQLPL